MVQTCLGCVPQGFLPCAPSCATDWKFPRRNVVVQGSDARCGSGEPKKDSGRVECAECDGISDTRSEQRACTRLAAQWYIRFLHYPFKCANVVVCGSGASLYEILAAGEWRSPSFLKVRLVLIDNLCIMSALFFAVYGSDVTRA